MSNPPKKNKKQESQDPWYDQYSYDELDIFEPQIQICTECGGQFQAQDESALCPDCEQSLEDEQL